MEQSVPISSDTFLGDPLSKIPPFLKKGPPKITEGGTFDPHWPISKINPAFCLPVPTLVLQPPPPPLKSIISHTHHSLFQCKHFFCSGLVYLVLLLDLNPFFSKLLPLSSHSCPLLLLSCFPFLLSSLSIPHVFSLFMEDSFTHIYLWHDYFTCISLLPLVQVSFSLLCSPSFISFPFYLHLWLRVPHSSPQQSLLFLLAHSYWICFIVL